MRTTRTGVRKTATKSAKPSKIPQSNGRGALYAGGVPGNKGGPGRPPSILRAELRDDYATRKSFLCEVIDGAVKVKTEVPLSEVLPLVHCPHCGKDGIEAAKGKGNVTIDGLTSPSMRDRMAALEHMAKYGMGTTITPTDIQGNTLIGELLEDVDPDESDSWERNGH
jgi:hypothetical protein